MWIDDFAKVLWQDFLAYRRGDRRVVPRFDVNGRILRCAYSSRRLRPWPLGSLV